MLICLIASYNIPFAIKMLFCLKYGRSDAINDSIAFAASSSQCLKCGRKDNIIIINKNELIK